MASFEYKYLDTRGREQIVEVTSLKQEIFTREVKKNRTLGVTEQYRNVKITLNKGLPIDLKIYFNRVKITSFIDGSPTETETELASLTIPKGSKSLDYEVLLSQVLTDGQRGTRPTSTNRNPPLGEFKNVYSFAYIFDLVAQPDGDLQAAELEATAQGVNSGARHVFEFNKATQWVRDVVCKVEIFVPGYRGSPETIRYGQKSPINFNVKGKDSEVARKPLMASKCEFLIYSEEEEQYKELFEYETGEVRMRYYEDNVMRSEWYNIKELYSETYGPLPYATRLVFSCGLGLLKRFKFEPYFDSDRVRLITVVNYCLSRIKTELPIHALISLRPNTASSQPIDNPLVSVTCDVRNFVDDGEVMHCGDVLREIMKTLGCSIMQGHDEQGKATWYIQSPYTLAKTGKSFLRHDIIPTNQFFDKESDDQIKAVLGSVKKEDDIFVTETKPNQDRRVYQVEYKQSQRNAKPIVSRVKVNKEMSTIPELFPGGEFDDREWRSVGVRVIDEDGNITRSTLDSWKIEGDLDVGRDAIGGTTVQTSRGGTGVVGTEYALLIRNESVPGDRDTYLGSQPQEVFAENNNLFSYFIRYRFNVPEPFQAESAEELANGAKKPTLPYSIHLNDLYLQEDFTFSIEPFFFSAEGANYGSWYIVKREDIKIPEDGDLFIRLYKPERHVPIDGFSVSVDYVRGQYKPEGAFAIAEQTLIAEAPTFTDGEEWEIDLIMGDADTKLNLGGLWYKGDLTQNWYHLGEALRKGPIDQMLAEDIIYLNFSKGAWELAGFNMQEAKSGIAPQNRFTTKEMPERIFIAKDYEYEPYTNNIRAIWTELTLSYPDVKFSYEESSQSKSGSGGGSSSTMSVSETVENAFDILKYITPGETENPIPVKIREGKLVVAANDVRVFQDLQAVSEEGNRTTLGLIAQQFSAGGVTLDNVGIEKDTGDIRYVARSGKHSFHVLRNNSISAIVEMSADGMKLLRIPDLSGSPIGVDSNGRVGKITLPTANNNYNSLSNKPITNESSGIKEVQGRLQVTSFSTAAIDTIAYFSASRVMGRVPLSSIIPKSTYTTGIIPERILNNISNSYASIWSLSNVGTIGRVTTVNVSIPLYTFGIGTNNPYFEIQGRVNGTEHYYMLYAASQAQVPFCLVFPWSQSGVFSIDIRIRKTLGTDARLAHYKGSYTRVTY